MDTGQPAHQPGEPRGLPGCARDLGVFLGKVRSDGLSSAFVNIRNRDSGTWNDLPCFMEGCTPASSWAPVPPRSVSRHSHLQSQFLGQQARILLFSPKWEVYRYVHPKGDFGIHPKLNEQ